MAFLRQTIIGLAIGERSIEIAAVRTDEGVVYTDTLRVPTGACAMGAPTQPDVLAALLRKACEPLLARRAVLVFKEGVPDADHVALWRHVCRSAGLEVIAVEETSAAYIRFVQERARGKTMLVVFGDTLSTTLGLVAAEGLLCVYEGVACAHTAVRAIAAGRHITYVEASARMKEKGLLQRRTLERRAVADYLNAIATDARPRTLKGPFAANALMLIGTPARIDGAAAYVGKKLKLPVSVVTGGAAVGAALKMLDAHTGVHGFASIPRIPFSLNIIRKMAQGGVFAVAVLALVGSIWYVHGEAQVRAYEAELARARGILEGRAIFAQSNLDKVTGRALALRYDARVSAAADTLVIGPTPGGWVHVRSGPGTEYAVIARVSEGDSYIVRNTRFGWFELEFEDGTSGWVYGTYATRRQ